MSLPSSRNSAWARVQWVACTGFTGNGGEHHALSSPAPRAPQRKACCKLPAKPCPNHAAHVKRIVVPHHCARKARADNRANLSHLRVAAACAPCEPSLVGPREARAPCAPPREHSASLVQIQQERGASPTPIPKVARTKPRVGPAEPRTNLARAISKPRASPARTLREPRARPARAPREPRIAPLEAHADPREPCGDPARGSRKPQGIPDVPCGTPRNPLEPKPHEVAARAQRKRRASSPRALSIRAGIRRGPLGSRARGRANLARYLPRTSRERHANPTWNPSAASARTPREPCAARAQAPNEPQEHRADVTRTHPGAQPKSII